MKVMRAEPVETIYESDALRVRYSPGRSRLLFVSFTGIRHQLGGIAADEFVGSTRRHHALFVSDLGCSWYNGDGIADAITDIVLATKKRVGADRVATIGTSMGGFGAILFARLLEAKTCISFAPQFSIHPDVVDDQQWAPFREGIANWQFPTPLPLSPSAKYFVFVGDDATETKHSRNFPRARNLSLFRLRADHDVAGPIKRAGLLPTVVKACIHLPPPAARMALSGLLRARGLTSSGSQDPSLEAARLE